MRVEQIMTRDVLTIGPEAEVREVARIFVEQGISGLPVCGARREVLGVVSEGDILFKEQGPAERERHLWSTPRSQVRKQDEQGARDQGPRRHDISGDHSVAVLLGRRGSSSDV